MEKTWAGDRMHVGGDTEVINQKLWQASEWVTSRYSLSRMLVLLLAAGGFFWMFNFSSWPISNRALKMLSGHEGLLDLMPYYSAQQAFTALGHYGVAGRQLYVKFLSADFVFIPIYSFGLAFLMTRILGGGPTPDKSRLWLNLLPFGIGILDWTENLFILTMLRLYPRTNAFVGTVSGMVTLCKYLFTLATVIGLGYGVTMLWVRRRRSHARSPVEEH